MFLCPLKLERNQIWVKLFRYKMLTKIGVLSSKQEWGLGTKSKVCFDNNLALPIICKNK